MRRTIGHGVAAVLVSMSLGVGWLSFAPLAAAEEAVSDPRAESLGTLLEAAPAVTGSVARQVERVDFGSRGTTVTLEGGKRIVLDFSGVSGVGGGPNYIGWAMLVFGMMVASRLISAVARLTRPLSLLGRRRRRDDD